LTAEIVRRENAEAAHQKADAQLDTISQQEAARIAGFVGRSPGIKKVLTEVMQLQGANGLSVLITGESGTGKELVARALHFGGSRAKRPFVALNCGAIHAELAESTLFGHVKGAFTGASENRKGCFEQADGGTLFLDEVGDMPLDLQVKLLRVLEEGHLTPVGGTAERAVDVQVVAATNSELTEAMGQGAFRQDLYFRLAQCRVEVPPLRQRPEDIPLLAAHFLQVYAADMGMGQPSLTPEVMTALRAYSYPGNVRELKNMMVHALIRCDGAPIEAAHLQFHDMLTPQLHNSGDEDKILAYVQRRESIGNTECRQLLAVDKRRATYLLDKMMAAGLLDRQGTGRWTRYQLNS
jgi:DNA-binding NtrC family response regulator